eukprot:Blabericola_migrator_1__12641@NODE_806_length_6438_cov_127_513734_g571_i0_p11_GENE_NODE_806_length_6438_cov_127_513734_g571_i0NODE_806_length_6438_cov_127_513734_g571_i0_p11_ORF_typecomplete_len102_score4_54_NODE_806_length_6438_cov_127_513734_g571_i035123817
MGCKHSKAAQAMSPKDLAARAPPPRPAHMMMGPTHIHIHQVAPHPAYGTYAPVGPPYPGPYPPATPPYYGSPHYGPPPPPAYYGQQGYPQHHQQYPQHQPW